MRSSSGKLLLTLAIAMLVYSGWDMHRFLDTPFYVTETGVYELKRGSSVRKLAQDLAHRGYIRHPTYLTLWTRLTGKASVLKAGEYPITPGTTPRSLVRSMVLGRVKQYPVTLIEGKTFRELLKGLHATQLIRNTLGEMNDSEIMQKLGHPGEHPEGRFYPDTYHYSRGSSDVSILQRAYDKMLVELDEAWSSRNPDLAFETPYQALIMASIIEKESAVAQERPLISGVFNNRLRKKMRLQTDPTVIYGIGDRYNGNIRRKHLRDDNPYNTYKIRGLPPTPIAMPGRESIKAALHPESTDYLYFVALDDNSGRHYFSATVEEHELAVDKYQRKRKRKHKRNAK